MGALTLLHRWLGVGFCLLFAMWFATGIVMHFVPFPALTESERVGGLAALDLTGLAHGPAEAVTASGISNAARVRLLQRADGPVYLVSGSSRLATLHAADLSDAAVHSEQLALAIALGHARARQLDPVRGAVSGLALYDQWTVPNGFDPHRPLYRIAINDGPGTNLYVSSTTGEVVLDTTRRERLLNYLGSIAHWIYPTALRSHPAVWELLVWWLSLLALVGATAGAVVGTLRIGVKKSCPVSPYRGWQAWHHWLGLICMLFVLTWIFSGWLSMDNGRLFSTGNPTAAEVAAIAGTPAWDARPHDQIQRVSSPVKEIEWFAFGGRIYRRERTSADQQRLSVADADAETPGRMYLRADEIGAALSRLARPCGPAAVVDATDAYRVATIQATTPIYRSICGEVWFDIDGASGVILQELDPSRRSYRWLSSALHTLDFPVLTAHPMLRVTLIVGLCGCGLVFSLTGVVIAWRRLLSQASRHSGT